MCSGTFVAAMTTRYELLFPLALSGTRIEHIMVLDYVRIYNNELYNMVQATTCSTAVGTVQCRYHAALSRTNIPALLLYDKILYRYIVTFTALS